MSIASLHCLWRTVSYHRKYPPYPSILMYLESFAPFLRSQGLQIPTTCHMPQIQLPPSLHFLLYMLQDHHDMVLLVFGDVEQVWLWMMQEYWNLTIGWCCLAHATLSTPFYWRFGIAFPLTHEACWWRVLWAIRFVGSEIKFHLWDVPYGRFIKQTCRFISTKKQATENTASIVHEET